MVDSNKSSEAKTVIDGKSAKKEINDMKKKAKLLMKDKSFQEAIELYNNAIVLATNFNLKDTIIELENLIRLTQIEGLKEVKKIFEEQAYIAEDQIDYERAIELYDKANKAAAEIFKLGVTGMQKEIKKLTKKSKELKSLLAKFYK